MVKLTFALTRLPYPKSARPAWIPESTIAIVGVFQDEIELSPLQVCDAPDSYGHSCA